MKREAVLTSLPFLDAIRQRPPFSLRASLVPILFTYRCRGKRALSLTAWGKHDR